MTEYTVIVDDTFGGIEYGPRPDDWTPSINNLFAYQGTTHVAQTSNASLSFHFTGGQKIVVVGGFIGSDTFASSSMYPLFQVDQLSLQCTPNPPVNGDQFVCSAILPSNVDNRTLTMFPFPNDSTQLVHIDYIRYGSNSQAAQQDEATTLFIQSPTQSSNTTGLTFEGTWQGVSNFGHASGIQSAALTSTANSNITYNFNGSSVAWWSCCMPPDTPGKIASGFYSIDSRTDVAFQIDTSFFQQPTCTDQRILFQATQLQKGNHTLVVTYDGDRTKMPLALCALAATPLDFSNLDPSPPRTVISSKRPEAPLPDQRSTRSIPIFAIVIISVAGTVLVTSIAGLLCWRHQKRKWQRLADKRSSQDSLVPFTLHPGAGGIPPEKHISAIFRPAAESRGPVDPGITTVPPAPTPPVDVQPEQSMPIGVHPDAGENRPYTVYSDADSQPISTRPPSYRTAGTDAGVVEVPSQ